MSDAFDREAFLDDLAASQWQTLAKHAWRLYRERGRGALVYPMEATGGDAGSERTPLRYLTFTDSEQARSGPFALLHQLVQRYDPDAQIVLAAQFPDDSTVFDIYERTPTPPEAA